MFKEVSLPRNAFGKVIEIDDGDAQLPALVGLADDIRLIFGNIRVAVKDVASGTTVKDNNQKDGVAASAPLEFSAVPCRDLNIDDHDLEATCNTAICEEMIPLNKIMCGFTE